MNFFLLVAHPELRSFNFALHNTAYDQLKDLGHTIEVSELYQQGFQPVAGQGDLANHSPKEFFQLGRAQRTGLANGTLSEDIKQEQEKLVRCDVLIIQFPLWWWSFPAILKGWIDRILSSGFAYGENAVLQPKKVMYSLTTGGATNREEREYYERKIDALYTDIFGFTGWETLRPFIAHGVQTISQEDRVKLISDYRQHLTETFS